MKNEYTKDDLLAFKRKDQLSARQSALKASTTVSEGTNKDRVVVMEDADEYYAWLIQDQEWSKDYEREWKDESDCSVGDSVDRSNRSSGNVLPLPTLEQKKWLENIEKKYGYTAEQIYKKCGVYPQDKNSAIKCVNMMKS